MNKKVGYVDGYVLVIRKDKVEDYKKMAQGGADAWMKHGALGYRECIGEDMRPAVADGQEPMLPFPVMCKTNDEETVWFSYIEYESKEHRDEVNKKVMKEMEEQAKKDPNFAKTMPFDMKRMAYGGFKVEVSG